MNQHGTILRRHLRIGAGWPWGNHGFALRGSRTGATSIMVLHPNPVNPVNPVQKTSERMAQHCAVCEPGLRRSWCCILILFILLKKRPVGWLERAG
jgi:hypothetical protein